MAETKSIKVLENCQISPPPNTVSKTPLHLSYLDISWFLTPPAKRLLFYRFPHPPDVFLQTTIPTLKHTLSLTLQHFFPFASNILSPPAPHEPYLLYSDGNSVPFTVAESTAEFGDLIRDDMQDAKVFHPLVPELPPRRVLPDGTMVLHPMAIQITIFPGAGICIGVIFHHGVADGMAFSHFLKSWASACKSKGDLSFIKKFPPSHTRCEIPDPDKFISVRLKEWWDHLSNLEQGNGPLNEISIDMVRATFRINGTHIRRLKQWVSTKILPKNGSESLHVSSFVVTCGLLWICMTKAQKNEDEDADLDDNKIVYFGFSADGRNRLGFSIPAAYFGNCLALCVVSAKRRELLGESGLLVAAETIGREVAELRSGGALRRTKVRSSIIKEIAGKSTMVAGSPKLRVYDTDFGWGRPKKSEVVHMRASGSIVLNECRDEEGGIEAGLALCTDKMKVFKSAFEEGLKVFTTP